MDITPIHEAIPPLEHRLPDLSRFVRTTAAEVESGVLRDEEELSRRIRDFYTRDRMAAIEAVAPGWQAMAAQADGATLQHITRALVVLQLLPEYRQAPRPLQGLMEWSELYHDLGKQVVSGQRDALHAFRSATLVARSLPALGFPVREAYETALEAWTRQVLGAAVAAPDGRGLIQDNAALPGILDGIDRLFGTDSAAALIVEAVLLHHSLTVVPEWPNPASLTEAQIPRCIRPALLPLLECVMLVDSDAWQLFDPESKARFRQGTLAVFADARRLIAAA
jgi:hypothetical protein